MNGVQLEWQPHRPAIKALVEALMVQTAPVYLVGGVVRDQLMNRAGKETDVDLVVIENALGVARRVADQIGWAYFPLDEVRDVARLVFTATEGEPLVCDIAGMRGNSLMHDLGSRDFTINAMALVLRPNEAPELVDPYNGAGDIRDGRVRSVSPTSLVDDPLRLVRAVRFAVDLGFSIEQLDEDQIVRLANSIRLVSPERIRDELWKALATQEPQRALEELHRLGLLPFLLPEVNATVGVEQSYPHYQDVFNHTMLAVEHAAEIRDWLKGVLRSRSPIHGGWREKLSRWQPQLQSHFLQPLTTGRLRADELVWHALLHDVGKPTTRSVERHPTGRVVYRFFEHEIVGAKMAADRLDALRYSNQEIALSTAVIEAHMRPHHLDASFSNQPVSRRALYRYFRDVGGKHFREPAGVDTLLLALADLQAIYADEPPNWWQFLDHLDQMLGFAFGDHGILDTRRRPLVDGFTLMSNLKLGPGPQIGTLLDQILEAQAAGEVESEEQALALAVALLDAAPIRRSNETEP